MAVDEHLIYQALGKLRTGDTGQDLDVGKTVYEVRSEKRYGASLSCRSDFALRSA